MSFACTPITPYLSYTTPWPFSRFDVPATGRAPFEPHDVVPEDLPVDAEVKIVGRMRGAGDVAPVGGGGCGGGGGGGSSTSVASFPLLGGAAVQEVSPGGDVDTTAGLAQARMAQMLLEQHGPAPPHPQPQPRALKKTIPAIDLRHHLLTKAREAHEASGLTGLAELIHNSYDAGATRLDIRVLQPTTKEGWEDEVMLLFADNGCGMSPGELTRLFVLSLDKDDERSSTEVGRWGLGAKYGTMRNADAALVFTCHESTGVMSVGLLSPGYLKAADATECPVASLDENMQLMPEGAALQDWIVNHSPFTVPDCYRILAELYQHRGTRFYLFGLRSDHECNLVWKAEAGVPPDIHDRVVLPSAEGGGSRYEFRGRKGHDHAYPLDYSLRSFCEVMFMEPTMSIYIFTDTGQTEDEAKVACRSVVAHGLTHVKHKEVKVPGVAEPISVVCGYSQKLFDAREGGILVYWHNVLIMPYYRDSAAGEGVVAIAAADHLLANAQKEVFVWSSQRRSTLQALVKTFETYAAETITNGQVRAPEAGEVVETWVLCDQCNLHRLLPPGCSETDLPVRWCCGSEPLLQSRCGVVNAEERERARAGRTLGYDVHGSASSQPTISVSKGSTFVIIHDSVLSGAQDALRFRLYAYRVKSITAAFGSRGCISLQANRGRFQVEVFRMARPCHPSDDPQNRWVMADNPRTMTFDLAKHKDDLAKLTVVGSLQPVGASKKATAWTMLDADWGTCLSNLSDAFGPDVADEPPPSSRQLSYYDSFNDLIKKKIDWRSFASEDGGDQLLELTDRGATCTVYSAQETVTMIGGGQYSRPVALKMLTKSVPPLARDFSGLDYLQREISLLSSCSGLDGIVTMYGIAFEGNQVLPKNLAIVCERKPSNLAQEMQNAGASLWSAWGEAPCLSVLQQIASAMLLLHSRVPMVVHRDLKPSNVLLEVDRTRPGPLVVKVWICDFGLAKEADTQEQTMSQTSVGTPAYRAPELATGGETTFHCDIFSWGMIALHMARGGAAGELQETAKRRPIPWGAVTAGDCLQLFNRTLTSTPATDRPSFSEIAQEMAALMRKRAENIAMRGDIERIRVKERSPPSVIVYRVLDVTDRPEEGLKAGNPADLSILPYQHVERTSVSRRSSYISTTLDPDWAMWWFAKSKFTHAGQSWPGAEIVAIDLDKLPHCNVLDVSDPDGVRRHMPVASVPRGKECSVSASEVLLQPTSPLEQLSTPFVPASAIVGVYRIRDMALTEKKTLYGRLEEGKVGSGAEGAVQYMDFAKWRDKIGSKLYGRKTCIGVMTECARDFVPQKPFVAKLFNIKDGPGTIFLGNAASRVDQRWAETYGGIQAIVQVRPRAVGTNAQPATCKADVKVLGHVWHESVVDADAVPDGVEPTDFYRKGNEALAEVANWIDKHLDDGHNVLIHSTHANKRTAAFAMYYVARRLKWPSTNAQKLVAKRLSKPIRGDAPNLSANATVEELVAATLPPAGGKWSKVLRQLEQLAPAQGPATPAALQSPVGTTSGTPLPQSQQSAKAASPAAAAAPTAPAAPPRRAPAQAPASQAASSSTSGTPLPQRLPPSQAPAAAAAAARPTARASTPAHPKAVAVARPAPASAPAPAPAAIATSRVSALVMQLRQARDAQPPNAAALSAALNDLERERMTAELLLRTEAGKAVHFVRKVQGVPDSVKRQAAQLRIKWMTELGSSASPQPPSRSPAAAPSSKRPRTARFKVGDRVENVVRTSKFYTQEGKVVDTCYKGGVYKVKVQFLAGTCPLQSEDNFRSVH